MSIFDTLVLGAYFGLMAILSLFGLHRYSLVYLYYRHRDRVQGPPKTRFRTLPTVTVQLPVYNEKFVVADLVDAICALRYPRHLLQIQVLDDSTDETAALLERIVGAKRAAGEPIEYLHRSDRIGYKAGALEAGLRQSTGEFIALFDADFTPQPDFLERIVHHFADPHVGMVQARWTFRNRGLSLLTKLQAMLLDGHFVFEHGARARSGRFFNFNGTAGILRRTMIEDAGGWQHDTLTEDTDLSYRAQLRGWKFLYTPEVEAPSELPTDMASFQIQQYRWTKGLVQTGIKLLPDLLRSSQPARIKLEGVLHLSGNIAYPFMLLLAVLILPSMLLRHSNLEGRLLWLDLPAFLMTCCSLSSFYTLAQREVGRGGVYRHLHLIPLLVAAGIALAISNTRAVFGALFGSHSVFERTAKYSAHAVAAAEARRVYGRRGGWRVLANLVAAGYFAVCLGIAIHIGHWLGLPVIALFLAGFCYAVAAMLRDSRVTHRTVLRTANEPPPSRSMAREAGLRETFSS